MVQDKVEQFEVSFVEVFLSATLYNIHFDYCFWIENVKNDYEKKYELESNDNIYFSGQNRLMFDGTSAHLYLTKLFQKKHFYQNGITRSLRSLAKP